MPKHASPRRGVGTRGVVYCLIARLLLPSAWWGRMRVEGIDHVPARGALLLAPNHDSQWDPVMVALALRNRRHLRFLARANLWSIAGLGPVLDALGQIPIERGGRDRAALARAGDALAAGDAVCVFPEGTLSGGQRLPARSGVGWLARARPEARVVLCAVEGATDFVRFPRRPRVRISFFAPTGGQPRSEEEPKELATRLLEELRERVPPTPAGGSRSRAVTRTT